jgi:hypothetical protein
MERATPTAWLRDDHVVILRAVTLLEGLGDDLAQGATVDREALGWLVLVAAIAQGDGAEAADAIETRRTASCSGSPTW